MDITDEDKEALKNTVDFVSLSYYSSSCISADLNAGEPTKSNLTKNLKRNQYSKSSKWGWQIDPAVYRGERIRRQ